MSKRTKRVASSKDVRPKADPSSLNALEQRVVAIAEHVGQIAGTAQAATDSWLDQPKFKKQLARIRKGAADLAARLAAISSPRGKRAPAKRPPKGRSGGRVDAPGKKHRKPPDAVRGVKHSDERIPKAIAARRMQRGPRRQG